MEKNCWCFRNSLGVVIFCWKCWDLCFFCQLFYCYLSLFFSWFVCFMFFCLCFYQLSSPLLVSFFGSAHSHLMLDVLSSGVCRCPSLVFLLYSVIYVLFVYCVLISVVSMFLVWWINGGLLFTSTSWCFVSFLGSVPPQILPALKLVTNNVFFLWFKKKASLVE